MKIFHCSECIPESYLWHLILLVLHWVTVDHLMLLKFPRTQLLQLKKAIVVLERIYLAISRALFFMEQNYNMFLCLLRWLLSEKIIVNCVLCRQICAIIMFVLSQYLSVKLASGSLVLWIVLAILMMLLVSSWNSANLSAQNMLFLQGNRWLVKKQLLCMCV